VGIFTIHHNILATLARLKLLMYVFSPHRYNGETATIIQTLHEPTIKTKSVSQQVETTAGR